MSNLESLYQFDQDWCTGVEPDAPPWRQWMNEHPPADFADWAKTLQQWKGYSGITYENTHNTWDNAQNYGGYMDGITVSVRNEDDGLMSWLDSIPVTSDVTIEYVQDGVVYRNTAGNAQYTADCCGTYTWTPGSSTIVADSSVINLRGMLANDAVIRAVDCEPARDVADEEFEDVLEGM